MTNLLILTVTSNVDIFIWILIILLFIVSFIGIVVPVIPGTLLLWLGFFAYHFFINSNELTWLFWIAMGIFTIVSLGADFYINVFFVDQFGGSKWSKWGALIGTLIGIFVYPPIGIILIPLLVVFVIELSIQQSFKKGMYASLGTLAGFLSSAVAKVFLQIVMIIIFFIFVIF